MDIPDITDSANDTKENFLDSGNSLQRFWTMMEAAVEKKDIVQNLTPLGLSALQDLEVGEFE